MTLNIVVDDGFAAFLNGVEVANFNRPLSLDWNSRAVSTSSPEGLIRSHPISIDFSSALVDGANVLAIHGMNLSISSSDFVVDAELQATLEDLGAGAPPGYFVEPTPGMPNGAVQLRRRSASTPRCPRPSAIPRSHWWRARTPACP